MEDKDLIIHNWVTLLCSYYSDMIDEDADEKHRLYAEMACELIPSFLRDIGVKSININRVLSHTYNLKGFSVYIVKHNPYISVCEEK